MNKVFKNVGHAIATGAKYFAAFCQDAVVVSQKAEALKPEAEMLIGAIAGPQAEAVADLGFHLLGDVAQQLEGLGADQLAAVSSNGLNLKLDQTVVDDVKKFATMIKAVLAAKGTPAPVVGQATGTGK